MGLFRLNAENFKQEELNKEKKWQENFFKPHSKPLDTLVCVQYCSSNGLSGRSCTRKYEAAEHPHLTEQLVAFLKTYPPEHLSSDVLYEDGVFDSDHWSFAFFFQDKTNNFIMRGYGFSFAAYPYLSKLRKMLPEVLTKEERIEREEQKRLLEEFFNSEDENDDSPSSLNPMNSPFSCNPFFIPDDVEKK